MSSWKAEVIADSTGNWVGNSLVFATEGQAALYAADLFQRWTAVRDIRVVETDKPVSAAWIIGQGVKHIEVQA